MIGQPFGEHGIVLRLSRGIPKRAEVEIFPVEMGDSLTAGFVMGELGNSVLTYGESAPTFSTRVCPDLHHGKERPEAALSRDLIHSFFILMLIQSTITGLKTQMQILHLSKLIEVSQILINHLSPYAISPSNFDDEAFADILTAQMAILDGNAALNALQEAEGSPFNMEKDTGSKTEVADFYGFRQWLCFSAVPVELVPLRSQLGLR